MDVATAAEQVRRAVLPEDTVVARDQGEPDQAHARSVREVCHDLVGPIATIKLLVESIGLTAELDPAARKHLRQIGVEAGRIADICDYFLNQQPPKKALHLDPIVAEVSAGARVRFATKIDVVTEPASVLVHPAVAIRILTNLLDNACRAAGPDGIVRVVARPAGRWVVLAVSDSGDGLGRATSGRASLGLDIVGALALEAGGSLELRASDMGGLGVRVTLPSATSARASKTPGV
jgi:signal transduction histidine kinase